MHFSFHGKHERFSGGLFRVILTNLERGEELAA